MTRPPSPADDLATEPPSRALRWRTKAPYLLLSAVIVILDQWSKWLVEERIVPGTAVEVIPGFLDLIHVRNTGVAFGLFASHGDPRGTLLLAVLGFAALGFVGIYFWLTPLWDRVLQLAMALVVGGAIGNLIDRVGQGAVTDFIDAYVGSYHWHTFNVADSAITVGIVLMLWSAMRPAQDPSATERGQDSADSERSDAPAGRQAGGSPAG